MNPFPTPTRDGDWRIIDGQLVDVSQTPPATAPEEPSEPESQTATRTRRQAAKTED